ncbi:MAG: chemotaxis-specific protein-glutamate methyltransferase CheB [Polyangiaceae bacterium]|nr:chemotaxis-specific protein-glutamate methyltransferase CheB [Polyangiaceae bacterium]
MKPLRIFVVDDSAVARVLLRHWLHGFDGVEIVGEARSGREALERVPSSAADLVIMDVVMPGMDGLAVTEELMATHAKPIVVMSELALRDATLGFRALSAGALDMMPKLTAAELADEATRRAFVRKLRMLAGVPVVTRRRRPSDRGGLARYESGRPRFRRADLVCIGASTGGPPALLTVLRALARGPACPIVIVQHMSGGFIGGMARWLADEARVSIQMARDGEPLLAGRVYLAPDDCHTVIRGGRIALEPCLPRAGYCPSVDALFESAARTSYVASTLGVLLTGMGADGAQGLLRLREAGAWTITQDEGTSVVYGMPRAAAELSAACEVLPIDRIASRVAVACGILEEPTER